MPINERDIFWDWDAACNRQDAKSQQELARYVLEDLDEVARIFHNAKSYLKDHAFYAYESDNPPQRAREEVEALYKCLQNGKPKAGGDYLAYVLEDIKSVRVRGKQRVRLAREVLFWGHGVCLDWVLLFAACVFKAHIYPLIIATSAHVILGYWLTEHDAETYGRVILSGAEIREHFSKERIKVINATRIPPNERGEPMSFDQAEDEAETHVPYALFAVDIRAARGAGIESLLPLKPWSGNHSLPPAEHFQERPELEDIHKWWRDENSYGVLALVGIGGVGKTAVVHRFLAQLPGSDIQDEGVGKDETLPIPDALFVWNFYQHPDIDRCATALYTYLTGEQVNKATFEQVQDVLSKNYCGCRVLLVFDGVEKLQIAPGIEPEEEGGTFGQFRPEGAPLGRFLAWCCDTPRPVHVLITSRFGLTELRGYESTGGYRAVDLGGLPLERARALLRAAGVKGLDWQLDEVIRGFGNHAQTLDLLGNALRIWCDGDPTKVSELPCLDDVKKMAGIRDKVWGRIRILRFYENRLPSETLRVLQLLTLFANLTVDKRVRLISAMLKQSLSALLCHIAALSHEYRLLPMTKPAERDEWEIHPALKDYFYFSISSEARIAHHQQLAELLSQTVLSGGFEKPRDWGDLWVLYELVHQLVAAGRVQEAFNIYRENMGAYDHIAHLDANAVGLRTVREMLESPYVKTLFPWQKARLLNDAGGFLRALGALEEGLRHYREALRVLHRVSAREERAREDIRFNRSVALRNIARVLVLQGRLRQAQTEADRAYVHERSVGDKEGMQIALCTSAYATGLRGDVEKAFRLYNLARRKEKAGEISKKEYAVQWSHLMLLAGMNSEAFDHVRKIVASRPQDFIRRFCELIAVMATVRAIGGDLEQAQRKLAEIERWADSVGRMELQIRTQLAKAELALRRLELAKCGEALRKGILLAERNGYGVYWIDLQVAKGQWELACGRQLYKGKGLPPELEIWTPQQRFELAEASALRALNGQLKDSDDPAPQPELPEDQLAMLGARHPECGYAWGEGDALHLLGEALLALAHCVGSHGHDSKGRSYKELLEKARQAAEAALALRKRIQDPKAKDTQDLLSKIKEAQGGDGP